MSKLEYREFDDYPVEELFERLVELITIDRDDIISKRIYNKEWKAIRERFIGNEDKIRKIGIYVRILQEGDPENETPEKIIDYIDKTLVTDGISKENES